MKIDSIYKKSEFQSNASLESLSFQADSGLILKYLSSSIYANPMRAAVQEYLSNARDAQIENGNSDAQIEIVLPTSLSPYLSIRDFGVGLSEDGVKVFTVYGKSTKRKDDKQIGGFGIGGKLGFAISDHFIVKSYFGGVVTTYICHSHSTVKKEGDEAVNGGQMDKLGSTPFTEQDKNGVEVILTPPKNISADRIAAYIFEVTAFWDVKPKIVNFEAIAPSKYTCDAFKSWNSLSETKVKLSEGLCLYNEKDISCIFGLASDGLAPGFRSSDNMILSSASIPYLFSKSSLKKYCQDHQKQAAHKSVFLDVRKSFNEMIPVLHFDAALEPILSREKLVESPENMEKIIQKAMSEASVLDDYMISRVLGAKSAKDFCRLEYDRLHLNGGSVARLFYHQENYSLFPKSTDGRGNSSAVKFVMKADYSASKFTKIVLNYRPRKYGPKVKYQQLEGFLFDLYSTFSAEPYSPNKILITDKLPDEKLLSRLKRSKLFENVLVLDKSLNESDLLLVKEFIEGFGTKCLIYGVETEELIKKKLKELSPPKKDYIKKVDLLNFMEGSISRILDQEQSDKTYLKIDLGKRKKVNIHTFPDLKVSNMVLLNNQSDIGSSEIFYQTETKTPRTYWRAMSSLGLMPQVIVPSNKETFEKLKDKIPSVESYLAMILTILKEKGALISSEEIPSSIIASLTRTSFELDSSKKAALESVIKVKKERQERDLLELKQRGVDKNISLELKGEKISLNVSVVFSLIYNMCQTAGIPLLTYQRRELPLSQALADLNMCPNAVISLALLDRRRNRFDYGSTSEISFFNFKKDFSEETKFANIAFSELEQIYRQQPLLFHISTSDLSTDLTKRCLSLVKVSVGDQYLEINTSEHSLVG